MRDPGNTNTAPECFFAKLPSGLSHVLPTARSSYPSWSKSPVASADANSLHQWPRVASSCPTKTSLRWSEEYRTATAPSTE